MEKKQIVIIDYGSGNLRSVEKAFEKVIADHNLSFEVLVTADSTALQGASHIVLPGQGAFADCMAGLRAVSGMIEALENQVLTCKKPFLGICVGMQLLMEQGLEHGTHNGLGWLKGRVIPITPQDKALKIPHMGWNVVACDQPHFMIKNQESDPHFYFVHSFMVELKEEHIVHGYAQYGDVSIPAIIAKNNIVGIQCHPEKSQEAGLQFLYDFLHYPNDRV